MLLEHNVILSMMYVIKGMKITAGCVYMEGLRLLLFGEPLSGLLAFWSR